MVATDVLILRDLSEGQRVRIARLVMEYTQAEVACLATIAFRELAPAWKQREKITPALVGFLERGWRIPEAKRAAVFKVVALDPGNE